MTCLHHSRTDFLREKKWKMCLILTIDDWMEHRVAIPIPKQGGNSNVSDKSWGENGSIL